MQLLILLVYDLLTLDVFTDSVRVQAITSGNISIPIDVQFVAALQSWSFSNNVATGTENTQTIYVKIYRSITTKFFSLMIISIMWLTSSFVLALAISIWLRDRKVEPPTIAGKIYADISMYWNVVCSSRCSKRTAWDPCCRMYS